MNEMSSDQLAELIRRHNAVRNNDTLKVHNTSFVTDIEINSKISIIFQSCTFQTLTTCRGDVYNGTSVDLNHGCRVETLNVNSAQQVKISGSFVKKMELNGTCSISESSEVTEIVSPEHKEAVNIQILCSESTLGRVDILSKQAHGVTILSSLVTTDFLIVASKMDHINLIDSTFKGKLKLSTLKIHGTFEESVNRKITPIEISGCKFLGPRYQRISLRIPSLAKSSFRALDLSACKIDFREVEDFSFKYNNVDFPTNLTSYELSDNWIETRTIFRRLKQNFELNNDHILSRIFASLELECYYRSFVWRPISVQLTSHFPFLTIKVSKVKNEFYPLWISKWSNDFGRDWILPILLLINTSSLFFLLSVLLISLNYNWWERFHYLPILWESGAYFEYIFPVHSFDIFAGLKTGFGVHLIDIIQRITSGFFIFQFIRAFRFHVAK